MSNNKIMKMNIYKNKKIKLIVIVLMLFSFICCGYIQETEIQAEINKAVIPVDNSKYYLPKEPTMEEIISNIIATSSEIDRMVFTGDIYFSKRMQANYDAGGIENVICENYRKLLSESDLSFGNLECAIGDKENKKDDKKYTFLMPSKYTKGLKEAGYNILSISNNHILDNGTSGLYSTMRELKKNDLEYIGAGKDYDEASKCLIKEIDGKKYAFISASAVLPDIDWKASKNKSGVNDGYDVYKICEDIKKATKVANKVIVFMHWGAELEIVPNIKQKDAAHCFVDVGADLVIGTHPHILQEIEYYHGVPIVYSLGNFIYGGTSRDTMMLQVIFNYTVKPMGDIQLIIYPGRADYEHTKMYTNKQITKAVIKNLQDTSSTCYIGENGYVFSIDYINYIKKRMEKEKAEEALALLEERIRSGKGVN